MYIGVWLNILLMKAIKHGYKKAKKKSCEKSYIIFEYYLNLQLHQHTDFQFKKKK